MTLEALRRTPKGSINYEQSSQWDKRNHEGKLRLLNEWSSPPPLSPEAVDYITERTRKLSLGTPTHEHKKKQSPLVTSKHDISTSHTPSSSITTPGRHRVENITATGDLSSVKESESLISSEFRRELDEQEQTMDDQMMQEVANEVEEKRRWLSGRLEAIKRAAEEQRLLEREKREREVKLKREGEAIMKIKSELKIKGRIEAFKEEYRRREEMIESNLRSGEEERREMIRKQAERREMELKRQLRRCHEQKQLAGAMMNQLSVIRSSCAYPQLLPQSVSNDFEVFLTNLKSIEAELVTQERTGHPEPMQIDRLQAKLSGILPQIDNFKVLIEEINQRGEKEARQREELLRQTVEKLEREKKAKEKEDEERRKGEEGKDSTATTTTTTSSAPTSGTASVKPGTQTVDSTSTELGMPRSMLTVYNDLQKKLSKAVEVTQGMTSTTDPALKKYRFELQKAITITVNSISANSGEDLKGKIGRLQRLIRGDSIEVMGKPLSIRNHPAAKMYCCNLLAKKLVKQGEDQVASNHEAAFPIAAVAVGIWNEFPDVGELILAHFYSACPVLVPLYVPRSKDMSNADHMKLQGYKVSSKGEVESEDMFLNRMRGLVRLYAAIIQTPPLPVGPQLPHRHSLEYGWAWLARVLNMEPHPTLTATAIGDFLETAGSALLTKYRKQFKKLLFVLCKQYVPKIEKVTPADQKGPLSRLKQFLEDCNSSGKIPQAKGCLGRAFWLTRSQGIAVA